MSEKNQKDFATLIKTKESNIKTWETTKSIPRSQAIYKRIAGLAGVKVEDIKNKILNEEDIKLKVEIVEDDGPVISPRGYIKELQEDKRLATLREERILGQLVANSTAMMQMLAVLQRHNQAFHETILKSLTRIEDGNTDLVLEARSYEAALQVQDSLKGSNVESGK